MKVIDDARDYARRLARVAGAVDRLEAVAGDVRLLVAMLMTPATPPPMRHFVQLLAFGSVVPSSPKDGLTWPPWRAAGGATGELVDGQSGEQLTLHFDVQRPLVDVVLLVFCDLARVQVDGVFVGHDLLALNLSSGSPIAFAVRAECGQRVTAHVRLRRGGP